MMQISVDNLTMRHALNQKIRRMRQEFKKQFQEEHEIRYKRAKNAITNHRYPGTRVEKYLAAVANAHRTYYSPTYFFFDDAGPVIYESTKYKKKIEYFEIMLRMVHDNRKGMVALEQREYEDLFQDG